MEGVTSEASSLAGHLGLGKLICFYDDNNVTIDGMTTLAFTEDRAKRYEAYGWQVLYVKDGNNVAEIDAAIQLAKADPRPSMICCQTVIGYGYPTWGGKPASHSGIPSKDELEGAKQALGYPIEPMFHVSDAVLAHFREALEEAQNSRRNGKNGCRITTTSTRKRVLNFGRIMAGNLPENWKDALALFPANEKGMATRSVSGKVINALAGVLPEFVGGSADLSGSNSTVIENTTGFQKGSYFGRMINYGVREHAMGAINNGLNQHGGLISFAATFFVFSDYLRPVLRISALSDTGSVSGFSLMTASWLARMVPPINRLSTWRLCGRSPTWSPCVRRDANEVPEAWKIAI